IVLPGGVEGATCLGDSALVVEMLKQQQCDQKWVAAICAAPALVLEKNGLFPDAYKSCHPAFIEQIPEAKRNTRRVMNDKDHKLITSQGPGSALEFAVEIVLTLAGKEKAAEVVAPMTVIPNLNYDKKFAVL
ncbi:DJ-1/PfpI family protein, partial [Veronia pacifica]